MKRIQEIKVLTLRSVEIEYNTMSTPGALADFWRSQVTNCAWYDTEKEQLVVFCLDSKLRLKAFNLVSMGLANQTLLHAREVYRPVIVAAAAHAILLHNHPSGVMPHPVLCRMDHDFHSGEPLSDAA
jgi:DNA repair protein RadC